MKVPFVDLRIQYEKIKDEIHSQLREVCEKTAFVSGPFVTAFEKEFAAYVGTRHCVGLNSGTAAVQLALQAFIQPGDEVITVPNTFIATTEAITAAGGIIKFVDINPSTYNLDPEKLPDAIGPKTRAVLPVHLYGQAADMDRIREIAKHFDLFVIEDAAQAHGATYKDKKAGSLAHAAAFSFYPGKNLGAYGEGGAVTTDSDKAAMFARMFADHGSREKYIHEFEGTNYRLQAFQGAVLRIKLKYLEEWTAARRRNAEIYNRQLKEIEAVKTPFVAPENRHVYHLYVVRVKKREKLQQFLSEKGIASGFHYKIPLHLQPAYKHLNYKTGDFPATEEVMNEVISLPMYPELGEKQIIYVCDVIKAFVKKEGL